MMLEQAAPSPKPTHSSPEPSKPRIVRESSHTTPRLGTRVFSPLLHEATQPQGAALVAELCVLPARRREHVSSVLRGAVLLDRVPDEVGVELTVVVFVVESRDGI